MSRLGTLLLGMIIGGAGIYTTLNYHMVRTNSGLELVAKTSTGFHDTYIDIRRFGVSDWSKHRDLAMAIVDAKKEHLFGDASANTLQDGLGRLFDDLKP